MIRYLVALLAAQAGAAVVVDDAALTRLALRESPLPQRLRTLIYDDPAGRAEIRRVGFPAGCRTLNASVRAVAARHDAALAPFTVAAIRATVPPERLAAIRILSFFTGPLQIYQRRIMAAVAQSAAPLFATAERELRNDFGARTRVLPTTRDPAVNTVQPSADIGAALGLRRPYDLDQPAELGMACAELLIKPATRPTITTAVPGAR